MIPLFKSCDKCKDSKAPLGYIYSYRGEEILGIRECECHSKWREESKLILDAEEANIWHTKSLLNYNPEKDYVGEESRKHIDHLLLFVNRFDSSEFNQASIYMWGPNGTQKTQLAHWLGLALLRREKTVKYLLMNQLLSKLSSNFEDDPERQKMLNEALSVDCLILDESFSKDKVTLYKSGYQLPFLDSFLRERVDTKKKSIVYLSNTSPLEIEKQGFTASIQDFILRKTKPLNSIFYMKDIYMKLVKNFDTTTLFN